MTLLSCEMDARVDGTYRLVFQLDPEPLVFHGRYLEVVHGAPMDTAIAAGTTSGDMLQETFDQLEALLTTLSS